MRDHDLSKTSLHCTQAVMGASTLMMQREGRWPKKAFMMIVWATLEDPGARESQDEERIEIEGGCGVVMTFRCGVDTKEWLRAVVGRG